jgi:hypothetical protein
MFLLPSFLAVLLIGPVVFISGHFAPLPEPLSGTLASPAATVALILDPGIAEKHTTAMGAPDLMVHGLPPQDKP